MSKLNNLCRYYLIIYLGIYMCLLKLLVVYLVHSLFFLPSYMNHFLIICLVYACINLGLALTGIWGSIKKNPICLLVYGCSHIFVITLACVFMSIEHKNYSQDPEDVYEMKPYENTVRLFLLLLEILSVVAAFILVRLIQIDNRKNIPYCAVTMSIENTNNGVAQEQPTLTSEDLIVSPNSPI